MTIFNQELREREYYTLWRKRNGVTLKEVASYIGVYDSTISRWERGIFNFADGKERKYDEFIEQFESKKNERV